MTKKGYKQSAEHVAKRIKRGESHPNWKGDDITEKGGRTRALRMYPEIGPCCLCGSVRSERHRRDGNTANNSKSNIIPLCRKCHMASDGRIEKLKKTAPIRIPAMMAAGKERSASQVLCKRGHKLSGENLYINRGRRVCKECRKLHKRNYRRKSRT